MTLDTVVIERERNRLRKENRELSELLKQCMHGLTVNDEVMNSDGNPLLIVNGRVTLNSTNSVRPLALHAGSTVEDCLVSNILPAALVE